MIFTDVRGVIFILHNQKTRHLCSCSFHLVLSSMSIVTVRNDCNRNLIMSISLLGLHVVIVTVAYLIIIISRMAEAKLLDLSCAEWAEAATIHTARTVGIVGKVLVKEIKLQCWRLVVVVV